VILRALAVAALILAAPDARAINANAGTSGGNFLHIGQGSARAMALGGAYVGLAEGSSPDLSVTLNRARRILSGVIGWPLDMRL
jgi:hypothetical protein